MGKIKSFLRDFRASYYLKKNSEKKTHRNFIKIAFIVFEPQSWDKEQPVFEELRTRKNVEVDILVVPSFNDGFNVKHGYGKEWEFFVNKYPMARKAVNDAGRVLDLAKEEYDYVFYQSPYNEHMPKELQSKRLVKYTKICYLPYGFSGANVFNGGNTNEDFFRNVYFWFGDVQEVRDLLEKRFSKNVKKGLQKFLLLGYPVFEEYDVVYTSEKKNPRILWTPRWSYHPVIGGSHFIEYKDSFVELSKKYKNISFAIRPHPMMFTNFIKENRITLDEKNAYIGVLKEHNIFLSESNEVNVDLEKTDILITDFSSIIPMFFLTGKPIIYCNSGMEMNSQYTLLSKGMYIAEDWNDVECYIDSIIKGEDYLKNKRLSVIDEFKKIHKDSAKKIVDKLVEDYNLQYR